MKFERISEKEARTKIGKFMAHEKNLVKEYKERNGEDIHNWNDRAMSNYKNFYAGRDENLTYSVIDEKEVEKGIYLFQPDQRLASLIASPNVEKLDSEFFNLKINGFGFSREIAQEMDLDYIKMSHFEIEELFFDNYFKNAKTGPNYPDLGDYVTVEFFDHRGVEIRFNGKIDISRGNKVLEDVLPFEAGITTVNKPEKVVVTVPFDEDYWKWFTVQSDEYDRMVEDIKFSFESEGLRYVSHNMIDQGSLLHKTREGEKLPGKELFLDCACNVAKEKNLSTSGNISDGGSEADGIKYEFEEYVK